jgi:hypothetical protein
MCASCAESILSLEELIGREFAEHRRVLVQQLRTLPALVDEYLYLSSVSSLSLSPQSSNVEVIHAVLAYVQYGPATLTLGQRVIPLPSGLSTLDHKVFLLKKDDVRTLVQAQAGQLSLELMGEEMPTNLFFSSW